MKKGTAEISWSDFEKVELRAGTITRVEEFPEARRPAYKIWADFGEYGERKTSAQITDRYKGDELIGKQIIGVLNFPPKQIGPFISEFLLTGFHDSEEMVIIATSDSAVPNGARLC